MADRGDSRTTQQRNRQVRQDALREYLSQKCSLEHIVDSINLIDNADVDISVELISRKKIALDARIKLLSKYLPDLKNVEVAIDQESNAIICKIERVIVDSKNTAN